MTRHYQIYVFVFAIAMMLAACENRPVDQLDRTNVSGDSFNSELARNYRVLADSEAVQGDWKDAPRYANKGLAATRGERVMPDDLSQRKIAPDKLGELQSAHGRLMAALNAGGASRAPRAAARAQTQYDCWAEQQEEGFQFNDIAACRNGFLQAIAETETALAGAPQASLPPSSPNVVFFAFNSATLSPDAERVLDSVAANLRTRGATNILIVGHTDRSGDATYNVRLSERRADAVRSALARRGVPATAIRTEARGESQPLVQTADGQREPQNRRASIAIQSGGPGV